MPGEEPDVLERARHARLPGDEMIGHAFEQKQRAIPALQPPDAVTGDFRKILVHVDLAVAERDPAFGRLIKAGNAVEDGGLAGAVRTDQRGDLAL